MSAGQQDRSAPTTCPSGVGHQTRLAGVCTWPGAGRVPDNTRDAWRTWSSGTVRRCSISLPPNCSNNWVLAWMLRDTHVSAASQAQRRSPTGGAA